MAKIDIKALERYKEEFPNLSNSKLANLIIKNNKHLNLNFNTLRLKLANVGRNTVSLDLPPKLDWEFPSKKMQMISLPKTEAPAPINVDVDILKRLEDNQAEINRLRELVKAGAQREEMVKTRGHVNKPVYENQEGLHLAVGCLHMPFHNKYMWDAILGICMDLKDRLKSINLIGDISDMHSISRHSKGKIGVSGLTLEKEYDATNKELNNLDSVLDESTKKHYLYGNHEDWYNQHMAEVDNFKLGEGVISSPAEALGYIERGYTVQTNWKEAFIKVGDIELIHGTYCGVHTCKKHLEVMKRNVAYVHTHSIGMHSEENIASYNIGWGGDKSSPVFGYMTRIQKEKWRNGFAIIYVDSKGISHLQQLELIDNKIYFEGKIYN